MTLILLFIGITLFILGAWLIHRSIKKDPPFSRFIKILLTPTFLQKEIKRKRKNQMW